MTTASEKERIAKTVRLPAELWGVLEEMDGSASAALETVLQSALEPGHAELIARHDAKLAELGRQDPRRRTLAIALDRNLWSVFEGICDRQGLSKSKPFERCLLAFVGQHETDEGRRDRVDEMRDPATDPNFKRGTK